MFRINPTQPKTSLRFCFHHGNPFMYVGCWFRVATIARPPFFFHKLQHLLDLTHHPWWGEENHCHHFTSLGLFDLPCGVFFLITTKKSPIAIVFNSDHPNSMFLSESGEAPFLLQIDSHASNCKNPWLAFYRK